MSTAHSTPIDRPSGTPRDTRSGEPRRRVGTGEPMVFFTGMGLMVGLVMITALLGVIVYKGLEAFWPLRAAQIELTADGAAQYGRPNIVAHILGRQERRGQEGGADDVPVMELKLQVANKDLNGNGFMFLNESQVKEITYPTEILRLERMEYGPALIFPISLTLADGRTMPLDDAAGIDELRHLIEESNARRREITAIERDEIGANALKLQRLRRDRRALDLAAGDGAPDPARLAAIDARVAELEKSYEVLAIQASALRDEQHANSLLYRIDSGRENRIAIGEIVSEYAPNQLGFFGRLGVFFHNMVSFIVDEPREANTEGGIFPALFGTFVMTLILSVAVTPFGVIAAIYLREYAKDGPIVRAVRIAINNLAGVPSIVFGVFGLGFFVYFVGGSIDKLFFRLSEGPVFGTGGILWASLTLALMTVPVVIVATEEALAAVSRGVREGSLACGASKWQTIQRIVLPAAAPGIITGMILAMARGAGEVAPLMITGVVKLAPTLPLDTTFPFLHLDRKFMHLGFHIYDLGFQSPDSEAARPMVFATTLLLIVLVVTMNLGAIVIRERLRRKYATGAF